ncbi:unnamed protein product, partial [Citrullus colocynthis]
LYLENLEKKPAGSKNRECFLLRSVEMLFFIFLVSFAKLQSVATLFSFSSKMMHIAGAV